MKPTPNNSQEDSFDPSDLFHTGRVHLGNNYNQLFTVEEAFVRLGQSCQTGEMMVLNQDETIHVFVEDGFVVHAQGKDEQGEPAFIHALDLEAANFVWVAEAKPLVKNLRIDIRQHVLRHSLSRDLSLARGIDALKRETLALPKREGGSTEPEVQPDYPPADEPTFYFVSAVDPMGRMELTKAVTLIGREIYCDWVIEDARISRKHCMVQLAKKGVLVRDLQSTNGTTVNGKPVTDGYMKPGDKLSLGGYILILQLEGNFPSTAPLPGARLSMVAVN